MLEAREFVGRREVGTRQPDHDDDFRRAAELVRKKLLRTTSADISDRDDRERLMRRLVGMLARRGYPAGLSFTVVKAELAELGADTGELPDL